MSDSTITECRLVLVCNGLLTFLTSITFCEVREVAHIHMVSIIEVHKYAFVNDVPDWNNMNVFIPELKRR